MLAVNKDRFSESPDNFGFSDDRPLELDELLTLIGIAAHRGYSVQDVHDRKSLHDVVSSELYAVWYAIENKVCILADNISHLIELTGWRRSSLNVYQRSIQQFVNEPLAA